MATSITGIDPLWADGVTFSAKELRQVGNSGLHAITGGAGPIVCAGGVVPGNADTPLKVTPSSGMTIAVAAGFAKVQGTDTSDQGVYTTGLAASGTIDVPAAHATLARYDLIVCYVDDNGDSTTRGYVALVQGTPAGSPAEPTPPTNSTTLARVTVPAAASSISAGNITDRRVYAVPAGGIVPSTSTAAIASPFEGQMRFDVDTNIVRVWDGSVWEEVGAIAAPRGMVGLGYNNVNSSTWNSITDVQVQVLASVYMQSGRKYKIQSVVRVGNAGGVNTAGDLVVLKHKIDSTMKSGFYFVTSSAVAGISPNCFTYTTYINDASSGNHAISLTGANLSGSGVHQLLATGTDRCSLAVEDLGAWV